MTATTKDPSPQLGLLDLSVDLSVPEVYSGTDFTVYLHIKNPFAIPVWVKSVELSLPTQLQWRSIDGDTAHRRRKDRSYADRDGLLRAVRQRDKRIESLTQELSKIPDGSSEGQGAGIREALRTLRTENNRDVRLINGDRGAFLRADDGSTINLHGPQMRSLEVDASGSSTINVYDMRPVDEPERVPLVGSLPRNVALEPGCTDVWTIRLGTGKSPFFLPAKYHLQLTVIYGLEPPKNGVASQVTDVGEGQEQNLRRLFSNTTSFTVPVKAALWNVMLGGVVGGAVGSVGRSLQDAKTLDTLMDSVNLAPSIGALILAVILSGAAIIFSARKSDAQSFVTVEDFWGGLLIGFLIGYSGTAAFSDITRVKV